MAPSSNYYHVGIVVNDIQAAQERLSALFGISWGPVLPISAVAYRDCDGPDLDLPTTLCYSVGDPGIELKVGGYDANNWAASRSVVDMERIDPAHGGIELQVAWQVHG